MISTDLNGVYELTMIRAIDGFVPGTCDRKRVPDEPNYDVPMTRHVRELQRALRELQLETGRANERLLNRVIDLEMSTGAEKPRRKRSKCCISCWIIVLLLLVICTLTVVVVASQERVCFCVYLIL